MVFRGILQPAPSFSSQLGAALGQGIGQGISGTGDLLLESTKKQMEQQNLFNEVKSLMGKGEEKNNNVDTKEDSENPAMKRPEILDIPDEAIDQLEINPQTRPLAKSLRRRKDKATEDYEHRQVLQRSFSGMVDLLPKVGFAVGPPSLSPSNAANRSEWEEYRLSLVGAARDLFNKGILTNQKFNYILGNIPEHGDRKSVKLGKLRGIGKEIGLDTSELDRLFPKDKEENSESRSSKKGSKSRKPLFNAENPEHKSKFNQLKKRGMSREEIEDVLSREYELD